MFQTRITLFILIFKRQCKGIKYLCVTLVLLFLFLMTILLSGQSGKEPPLQTSSLESLRSLQTDSLLETPLPSQHNNQQPYSSTLDNQVLSTMYQFKDKLLARQVEMQELIRNISASMSANPLVKEIQASRNKIVQYKYTPESNQYRSGDAQWQGVSGTRHKFYVYSAYCDDRDRPLVRVIAATKTKKSDKVLCKLYYGDDNNKHSVLVQAGINAIRENWNLNYSAAFVTCSLVNRTNNHHLKCPHTVSIVHPMDREPPSNYVPVHYYKTGIKSHSNSDGSSVLDPESIGVCVKPLHFTYNKSLELLQFIELNRILGVSKFTLYNDTISEEVSCLLSHYINQGIVTILPWKLDMISQKEIRTEGLFAALNDCLYRNMKSVQYLIMMDLDELIIPYQAATLTQMLADLRRRSIVQSGKNVAPNQVSSYSFQNAFFYLQWPDSTSSYASMKPSLTALTKTRRRHKLHPPKQRSKYICLPSEVKEAGNHFVWEFYRGKTLNVPASYGLLHHYRVCEFGGDDCVSTEYVEDDRVGKIYGQTLINSVRDTIHKSGCHLDTYK